MTWYNELRRIGTNCAFDVITTDEIYRDHLVSIVLDERVRDKLLEKQDLTLEETLDIIRNSEVKAERAKAWSSIGDTDVHAISGRLDCCNYPYHNITLKNILKFERVHNCLARVVTRSRRFSQSVPHLKSLATSIFTFTAHSCKSAQTASII